MIVSTRGRGVPINSFLKDIRVLPLLNQVHINYRLFYNVIRTMKWVNKIQTSYFHVRAN